MPINYLDGRRFRNVVVAGADWVRHTREHINRINVFPVPDGDTGTNMALSLSATAALVSHPQVTVFDSASASLGLGMMTLNAARLSAKGASMENLIHWLERWREDTGLVFSLATLEFLRRGGRIGAAKSIIGGLLGLRPILTFEDGNIVPLAKARGDRETFDRALEVLKKRLAGIDRVRLGLVEIGSSGALDRVETELKHSMDVVEVVRGAPTGVIGAHAGPGAWGVFYQRVRDDDPLLA